MKRQAIIIIGATSGIDKALFKKYATNSNRIGIVGRRTHLLDELRQEHPDTTVTATADITKQEEIAQAIDAFRAELKDIDLAIVCSGTGDINASLDYAVERPTIETNVMGWTFVIDTLYHIFELRAARPRPPRRHHLGRRTSRRADGSSLQRIESLPNQLPGSPAQEGIQEG